MDKHIMSRTFYFGGLIATLLTAVCFTLKEDHAVIAGFIVACILLFVAWVWQQIEGMR